MDYRKDDYTEHTPEEEEGYIYHGTSAETGAETKSITPSGEILDEETLMRRETGEAGEENEDLLVKGTSADVTKEDLEALGPVDLSMDMGDDESLKHRVYPVDFAGSDLDIPGSELDDDQEELGSEDEENNSYSLGDN